MVVRTKLVRSILVLVDGLLHTMIGCPGTKEREMLELVEVRRVLKKLVMNGEKR